jgi:hypothetical protein
MVFLFHSFFEFLWNVLLYFCIRRTCDDVVRRNRFLNNVLWPHVPVHLFWLVVVFQLLSSFWSFVFVRNWVVADAICVTPVVSEDLVFVLDFLFFKLLLFALILPSFLISFHSFHQSCFIKMVFSIALILSDNSVVDLMIFIEALLF